MPAYLDSEDAHDREVQGLGAGQAAGGQLRLCVEQPRVAQCHVHHRL